MPHEVSLSATICAVRVSSKAVSGMAMDVAADGGQLGREAGETVGRDV